jgi:hypothetical protein
MDATDLGITNYSSEMGAPVGPVAEGDSIVQLEGGRWAFCYWTAVRSSMSPRAKTVGTRLTIGQTAPSAEAMATHCANVKASIAETRRLAAL